MCFYIGQGNFISLDEVILLTNTNSVFFQRIIQDKETIGQVIDLTSRKPTNCIILTASGFFFFSPYSAKNLILKLQMQKKVN